MVGKGVQLVIYIKFRLVEINEILMINTEQIAIKAQMMIQYKKPSHFSGLLSFGLRKIEIIFSQLVFLGALIQQFGG